MKTSTQLKEVKPHSDAQARAMDTKWLMDRVIYIPAHAGIPEKDLMLIGKRLVAGYQALRQFGQSTGAKFSEDEYDKKYALKSKL